MKERVNTKLIAKELSLSRTTVSRVLNGKGRISAKTRKLVLDKALQLGYFPNNAARALVLNKTYKIAVIIFSEPEFFWMQVKKGIDYASKELFSFGLHAEVFNSKINSPEEQIKLLYQCGKSFDAIAIAPNDPHILRGPIDELTKKGIPVVTFNNDVSESKRLCYVGSNYVQCGMLAGELMSRFVSQGDIAILDMTPNISTMSNRIQGFVCSLKDNPKIRPLFVRVRDPDRSGSNAYAAAKLLIAEKPQISGIFVSYGVLEQVACAISDSSINRHIRLIGFDLNNQVIRYLRNGIIDAVITQEPFVQGDLPIRILYRLLAEEVRPNYEIIKTKAEIVMQSNLECYVNEGQQYTGLQAESMFRRY